MAFEAFLLQDKAKPKAWRRITFTISLALHGALLVAGAVYSFWHVEELSPPRVTVTFLSAAPPPPPPPPPPAKKKKTKPKTTPTTQPRPDQIVQPKELEPIEEEEDEGVEGGVEGGVPGGVVGGLVGSTGTAKMLPPNIGSGQLAVNVNNPPYKPTLPAALNRAGNTVWGLFKICVTEGGAVKDVKVIKSADPLVDTNWAALIQNQWRYKPYSINGRPVPFCYTLRLAVASRQY